MKTLDGSKITYEMTYNLLESLKPLFREGSTPLNTILYCQDAISDIRLSHYPDIELLKNNSIVFNYECNKNGNSIDHLAIKIGEYGIDFNDKIISYLYIKGNKSEFKSNVSWNDAVQIIKYWHSMD
jgi:hypothetical protein